MQAGRDFSEWTHTASVEAALANTVRDEKKRKRPFVMQDFHPHILHAKEEEKRRKSRGVEKPNISILRDVFVDGASMGDVVETHGI